MLNIFRMENQRFAHQLLAGPDTTPFADGPPGFRDGSASSARFWNPMDVGLSADAKILYVADYSNHAVRMVDTTTGYTTTLRIGSAGQHTDLCYPRGLRVGAVTGYVYVACNDGLYGFILRLDPSTGGIIDFPVPYSFGVTNGLGISGFDLNAAETNIYGQGLWFGFFGNPWNHGAFRGPIGSPTFYTPFGGGFNSVFCNPGSVTYLDDLDIVMSSNRGGYPYSEVLGLKALRGSDMANLSDIEGGYGSWRTPFGAYANNGTMLKFKDDAGHWHLVRYRPEYWTFDIMLTLNALDVEPAGGPWPTPSFSGGPDPVGGGYYNFWGPPGYGDGSRVVHPYGFAYDPATFGIYFADNPLFTGNQIDQWGADGYNHSHSIYMLVPVVIPHDDIPAVRLHQRSDEIGLTGSPRITGPRSRSSTRQRSIRVGPSSHW